MERKVLIGFILLVLSGCSKSGGIHKSASTPVQPTVTSCNDGEIECNKIISHSVRSNPLTQSFDFEITYQDEPEFMMVDNFKRQANGFQFYITYNTTKVPDAEPSWDVIIRGEEIHIEDTVRLRNPKLSGPQNFEESGGWGPLMTNIGLDYETVDRTVSFSIPWSIMGDNDGRIYYDLMNTNYGGMNLLIKNTLVDY